MNKILLPFFLLFISQLFSQIGINTTTPDPSSMLDVSATNKGALFPRVSLSNTNLTTLDGTNTAATGLLIWNTNATTTGGNGVGYYYFNGTIWVPVVQTGANDHDWYELNATTPANAISDNIYAQGKVSIGSSTLSDGKFNIYNTNQSYSIYSENSNSSPTTTYTGYFINTGTGVNQRYGLLTDVSGAGSGIRCGIQNWNTSTTSGSQIGVQNLLNGSNGDFIYGLSNIIGATGSNTQQQFGVNNNFSTVSDSQITGVYNFNTSGGNGHHYGTHNRIIGNGNGLKFGVYNFIGGNGTGARYGSYNYLTGTGSNLKYGIFSQIDTTAGGTHYGLYSETLKTGSFAGYFLGNVSVGTTTTNNYILPPSRGTANQIMQTDGVGNVSWVNPPIDTDNQATDVFSLTGTTLNLSLQNDGVATQTVDLSSLQDNDWFEVGGTNPPNAITDNKFTLGDISIGKITAASGKLDVDAAIKNVTTSFTNNNTTTGSKLGIQNSVIVDTNNNFSYGISNSIAGNADFKYGIYNTLSGAVTGGTFEYGLVNNHTSGGTVNSFGVFNAFNPSTSHSGFYNGIYNTVASANHIGGFVGVDNAAAYATNNSVIGINNSFGGSGSGERIGMKNTLTGTSTNDVTGIDTEILATGTGAKYGERIQISNISGGTHYGIYSDVTKSNSFAGYFLGRISIGTTITDNYILPPSRGTNGQIMRTDGAGNVSWVNPPSDADWYEIGTTNPPNAITDNIFTQGNVAIGKNTISNDTKVDIDNNDKDATLTLLNTKLNFGGGWNYGIHNTLDSQGNEKAILNELFSLAATSKIGQHNFFQGDAMASVTGCLNEFENGGAANQIGINNQFSSTSATGNVTGVRNWFPSSSNYTNTLIGNENDFDTNNNGEHTAISNIFTGTGSGTKYGMKSLFSGISNGSIYSSYTDITTTGTGAKYGTYNRISTTAGGIHYGVYSDVIKSNSFAGYFLGRISIGSTTVNNYILPLSRGTLNQIMQTDGTGNVSWVNPTTIDDQTIDVFSLTGNTLNLSLQDDAVATQTLDLSPIANTHWTDVTTHIQPTIASKSVVIGDAIVAPTAKLSIKRDSAPATPHLEIVENQANDDGKIKFSNAVELLNDWSIFARADDTPASNLFNINHTIGGNIVRINGEGRVGIMRAATTNALEVGGDASKTTAGAWLANSDSRLKKNITTISPTEALNKILSLRGVNYQWNDDKTGMKRPEGNQIGFIAQEIQEVFPEKVSEDKQGYLQTAYGDYDPIIFQAIKALNEKIEKLEKENEELKRLVKSKE